MTPTLVRSGRCTVTCGRSAVEVDDTPPLWPVRDPRGSPGATRLWRVALIARRGDATPESGTSFRVPAGRRAASDPDGGTRAGAWPRGVGRGRRRTGRSARQLAE